MQVGNWVVPREIQLSSQIGRGLFLFIEAFVEALIEALVKCKKDNIGFTA
jgi:hypothetical protein